MGEVSKEMQDAITSLGLGNDIISKTGDSLNEILYEALLEHFVKGKDRRWWWEAFESSFSFTPIRHVFEHLNEIIPELSQNVWLMVEDDQEHYYPIYDVNPKYIKAILAECFGFEYYIIDKNKRWLLCRNHHNRLIGIGDILKEHNLKIIT